MIGVIISGIAVIIFVVMLAWIAESDDYWADKED